MPNLSGSSDPTRAKETYLNKSLTSQLNLTSKSRGVEAHNAFLAVFIAYKVTLPLSPALMYGDLEWFIGLHTIAI